MLISILSAQRTAMRALRLLGDWAGWSKETYLYQRVNEYRLIWERVAMAEGGTFTELASDLWQIDVGHHRVRVLNYQLEFDNPVTLGLAGRKRIVHGLLGAAGVSVPEHLAFTLETMDAARDFVANHPLGCVIKPSGGYGGRGVTTHVQLPGEVRSASLRASVHDPELLVEAMIPGESFRLLVLEGKVVDAVYRRGSRLTGDGVSTIRELLGAETPVDGRRRDPGLDDDRDVSFTLVAQGLTLESRLDAGRVVLYRSTDQARKRYAEVRTVYTDSARDLICESIRSDAEAAARVIGSDFLGVDVITLDPSVPLSESGGVINEVNTTPALHHHYDMTREPYPEAAVLAIEALLRRPSALVDS
ncbi:MAG TPA: hypothetical protein VE011_04100 [Candidatus Dormibacteraeota bacterium]|nr:hypothetical protein [Candidatus Dormibacteraeota bacterium]